MDSIIESRAGEIEVWRGVKLWVKKKNERREGINRNVISNFRFKASRSRSSLDLESSDFLFLCCCFFCFVLVFFFFRGGQEASQIQVKLSTFKKLKIILPFWDNRFFIEKSPTLTASVKFCKVNVGLRFTFGHAICTGIGVIGEASSDSV